jgi:hypothetical protein
MQMIDYHQKTDLERGCGRQFGYIPMIELHVFGPDSDQLRHNQLRGTSHNGEDYFGMGRFLDQNDKQQDSDHLGVAVESDKGWDFPPVPHRSNPIAIRAWLTIVEHCVEEHAVRLQLDYISNEKRTGNTKLYMLTMQS